MNLLTILPLIAMLQPAASLGSPGPTPGIKTASDTEVVWQDDTVRYVLYTDTIFDVVENEQRSFHVVVHIEENGVAGQTSASLINCDAKTWRPVWSANIDTTTGTHVAYRDYSRPAHKPNGQGPMSAIIARVCEQP